MGESSQTQTSTLCQQVLAVADDGAADVRVTYESIQLMQDGPMGHQEFDSESGEPPADPMAGEIDFDVDRGVVLRSMFKTNMDMSTAGQSMRTESTVEMMLLEG